MGISLFCFYFEWNFSPTEEDDSQRSQAKCARAECLSWIQSKRLSKVHYLGRSRARRLRDIESRMPPPLPICQCLCCSFITYSSHYKIHPSLGHFSFNDDRFYDPSSHQNVLLSFSSFILSQYNSQSHFFVYFFFFLFCAIIEYFVWVKFSLFYFFLFNFLIMVQWNFDGFILHFAIFTKLSDIQANNRINNFHCAV